MVCPSENALNEFLQGTLPEQASRDLEDHIDACDGCRRVLSELSRLTLGPTVPARRRDRRESTGSSPSPVPLGQVIAGKYRVERVLGNGGMGVVVAATHLQLGPKVALKFMLPNALGDSSAVSRFMREAKAVVQLKSEHVGRVLDLGALESGTPYIVMEYLEGKDLDRVLAERGPLPPGEASGYVIQALEAIGEAHAAGIVHRDLKPANLFLTQALNGSPFVKVLDFGVSKQRGLGAAISHATQAGTLLGSPLYMAPEQLRASQSVDARSDIWSLGCTLYELVSDRLPFEGASIAEVAVSVLERPPAPLHEPGIPGDLQAVIFRCLEKDPSRRFVSAEELSAALSGRTGSGPSVGTRTGRLRRLGMLIAAGVALVASTAALLFGKHSPPTSSPVNPANTRATTAVTATTAPQTRVTPPVVEEASPPRELEHPARKRKVVRKPVEAQAVPPEDPDDAAFERRH